ncbi:MAG: sulfite oxidase [Chloroflexi bacterium]|nr:sulfite oxidase [Chloroflexota bacterium]
MPLYLAEHTHTAETCPTQQPEMMEMLGQHVTQANADKYGITIQSDVVRPGEHRMLMVIVAPSQDKVDEFMQPFGMIGTVSVLEVRTCEQVVATARC